MAGGNVLDEQFVQFSTMLTVRDLSRSEEFYTRIFGLRVTESLKHLRRLERPGVSLYLIAESPPTLDKPTVALMPLAKASEPSVNLVFHVRDVRATVSALRECGLEFLSPATQPPWGGWRAFAQDPDGYLLEIEQPSDTERNSDA